MSHFSYIYFQFVAVSGTARRTNNRKVVGSMPANVVW